MKRLAPVVLFAALALAPATAHANTIIYTASLSGPNEASPNASPGTGFAVVTLDLVANTMQVEIQFSDLVGTTTASHIHCCTALPDTGTTGVATITPTFTGFPLGVKSGTYDLTYDLLAPSGTYNPSFVTAQGSVADAEAALLAGMAAGKAYLNIHTTSFGGGEIRGFLTPVPEPASLALLGTGLVGTGLRRWRKRRSQQ